MSAVQVMHQRWRRDIRGRLWEQSWEEVRPRFHDRAWQCAGGRFLRERMTVIRDIVSCAQEYYTHLDWLYFRQMIFSCRLQQQHQFVEPNYGHGDLVHALACK